MVGKGNAGAEEEVSSKLITEQANYEQAEEAAAAEREIAINLLAEEADMEAVGFNTHESPSPKRAKTRDHPL